MAKGEWAAPGKKPPPSDIFPFECVAGIAKVMTMADGSYRVWLDLGENDTPEAVKIMALRRNTVQIKFIKRVT